MPDATSVFNVWLRKVEGFISNPENYEQTAILKSTKGI